MADHATDVRDAIARILADPGPDAFLVFQEAVTRLPEFDAYARHEMDARQLVEQGRHEEAIKLLEENRWQWAASPNFYMVVGDQPYTRQLLM
jgi:hypothetical protein